METSNFKMKARFSKSFKKIHALLREEKFEELASIIKSCSSQEVKFFCECHGRGILSFAFINPQSALPLKFVLQNFEYAQEILKQNDNERLDILLRAGLRYLESKQNSENQKFIEELLLEKVRLLMTFGDKEILESIKKFFSETMLSRLNQ